MVGGLAVVALDDVDVTDIFCAADDVDVVVDDENQLNKFPSFFPPPPPPVACCWPDVDDTIDGESWVEDVVLLTPNDDAMPCKSLCIDASMSKLLDDRAIAFALNSISTFSNNRRCSHRYDD